MALTQESLSGAARQKARRARQNVKAAEEDLVAANEVMKEALPRRDVEAIAEAAELTVTAEEEVRQAAQELEAVEELLDGSKPPSLGGTSGEGASSLLPWLRGKRG